MTLTMWGLKSCDTCRKARKWLESEGIGHVYRDVRADGVPADALARWAGACGWEALLNKASTTWRGLDAAQKDGLDETRALNLLAAHPTLIKRPIFERGEEVLVGFKEAQKTALQG